MPHSGEKMNLHYHDLNSILQFYSQTGDDKLDVPNAVEMADYSPITLTNESKQWVDIIQLVNLSGDWNKDNYKIRVNNHWKCALLRSLLVNYDDHDIVDFLQYGWPIEHNEDIPIEFDGRNHCRATNFEQHIDNYLQKEIALGATIGLFENIPFKCPVAISPLSTRAKKGTTSCRSILDCSWPLGCSLNDGIDKDMYLGHPTKLTYPTVDSLAKCIFDLTEQTDKPVLLFRKDLDRAFRQLWVDPKSVPLLGFRWRGKYYFDLVMVMGCNVLQTRLDIFTQIAVFTC